MSNKSPPVHPRGCGEHAVVCLSKSFSNGSSPRVRGTHFDASHDVRNERFIPAGAGNTKFHPSMSASLPVHPRGCGEHFRELPLRIVDCGSSPRVRGTRSYSSTPFTIQSVHPRGCGEHGWMSRYRNYWNGSSPRVRGTRSQRGRSQRGQSVHPRGCGEHVALISSARSLNGSSPRVRGTRQVLRNI